MQKYHIIFAGCSFSDEGVFEDNFNVEFLKNKISYQTLRIPTTMKIHKYFALDLINENKIDDVKIYTIARGSYGNHVIFDKLKEKIIDIKLKYPNDKIYALVQLSALVRPSGKMNNMDIDINRYPHDYCIENLTDYESIKNVFLKHISNIENINNFCKENNVINKIFFGWANLFMEDFIEYKITNKIDDLNKIVTFYKYNNSDDEMETYCAGNKPKLKSTIINGINTYDIPHGQFGGISEYGRDNLSIGRRYNLITDAHPSSNSYYVFYKNFIKQWFIDNAILTNNYENENYVKLYDNIYNFEYIKFMNTLNVTQSDNELISNLSWEIVMKNKLEDTEFVINEFKKLNNKYI
jgi:hypothetical protein